MPRSIAQLVNLNLKLLQTFILVAEHQSFRQAAELSFRSQSAISAQIRALEEQLGVVLFHRTTRQVALTVEGLELLDGARRAMDAVNHSLRIIEESVELSRGRVVLGCAPTLAAAHVPQILAHFEHDYPNVRVYVREEPSQVLQDGLLSGELDLAFAQHIGPHAELRSDVLLDDPLYALVPHAMGHQRRRNIRLKELANLPLLLLAPMTAMSQMFEDAMHEAGLTFECKHDCVNALTLIAMADAGLGVAILPRAVLQVAHTPNCQALTIQEPALARQIALITRRDRALSPAAARLSELIRQTMTNH